MTLTNVQFNQAGNYAVLVTNILGSVNSSNALLTVIPCMPAPSGLVDWWPGEGNAYDTVGTNNGTLINGAYTNGMVGEAFSFSGSNSYVSIPDPPFLDSFTTNITVELWMKAGQTNVNAMWKGIVTKGNSSWRLQALEGANTINWDVDGSAPSRKYLAPGTSTMASGIMWRPHTTGPTCASMWTAHWMYHSRPRV